MSARKVAVEGIIIGRYSAGEGSVRIQLYTDALGLVTAAAKSAREERSQLRAHLQAGTRGVFSLVKGRDVWRVTGAVNTANPYFMPETSSETHRAVARILAFVRQFVRGEGSDPYFFRALSGFFAAFPYHDETHLKDAECVAILRMLSALGYIEESSAVATFLPVSYDQETLLSVRSARPTLVKAINEGISASGLSA